MIRVLIFLMALASFAPLHAQNTGKEPPKKFSPEELKKAVDDFVKKFDLNKDGFLSQDELPKFVPGAVGRLDRNGDGKLDRREVLPLVGMLRGSFPLPGPDGMTDNMLKRLDADGDGKVSKAEAQGPILESFERVDANKDGFLDRAELRVAAQRFLDLRKKGPPGIDSGPLRDAPDFDALDKDADGRLNREELKGTPWVEAFSRFDTDNSGQVDRREFEAFFRKDEEKKAVEKK